MAIGVLRAARDRGVRVPGQLSVIGVDDHEMAEHLDLTTVRQPVVEQGRTAARQILGLLGEAAPPEDHVVLDAELVVRGSTGRAPGPG